ncbi:hypothetical protein [Caulobacter soli]|uniref:hypothetical protein n=1 Tax=Caulobacter soli TaxID=2708539 RepID=UPI0013EB2C8F|nr:hypothetical protein [Caulobacter soli]
MSLDTAALRADQDAFSGALASDPAASILRHAVKIWASDHGIAGDDLSRLTHMVVDFASSAIRDCERRAHPLV